MVGKKAGKVGMNQVRMSFVCRAKEVEIQPVGNGELMKGSEQLNKMIYFFLKRKFKGSLGGSVS